MQSGSGSSIKNDLNSPIFLLNMDVFIFLCEKLDPWSLYYLSRSNKLIQQFAYSNIIWERILLSQFQNFYAVEPILERGIPKYFFTLYGVLSKARYKNFAYKNEYKTIECFTLVRANALFTIIKRNISFDITLLDQCDSDQNTLFSIVKDINNPKLNDYIFKKILEKQPPYPKESVISCGIRLNQSENLFEILKSEANINELSIERHPIVYYAAAHNNVEILEYLIKLGASINVLSSNGGSPLYIAMQEGHTKAVQLLLKKNADIRLKFYNFTPLYIGARQGHVEALKLLLPYCNDEDIHVCGNDSSTALYVAAQGGKVEACRLLLEKGANPELQYMAGYTPLYIAAQNGHKQVVKLLIQFGADPSRIVPNGTMPFYIACQNGFAEIVKLFCGHKNKYNFINHAFSQGYTPLYIACQKGHLEVVKLLIAEGANINYLTYKKASPLYAAAQHAHVEIVKLLIANKANVNSSFQNGYTPLHLVCALYEEHQISKKICFSLIKILTQAGADLFAKDNKNKTPSMFLYYSELYHTMILFEQIIQHCNKKKTTPFPVLFSAISIINEINNYIEKVQNKMGFTVSDIDNSKKINSAKTWICFLEHTNTNNPFAQAIILYALLIHSGNKSLTQLVLNTLKFSSLEMAKNTLHTIIIEYLGENSSILHSIVKPILSGIKNNKAFSSDVYDLPLLCFDLYATKMNLSPNANSHETSISAVCDMKMC